MVEAFLTALQGEDIEGVMALVDDDIVYENRGLPAVAGRRRVGRIFRLLDRRAIGFQTHIHTISAVGATVLTERTDVHRIGPLTAQFWVCGRYDVHHGKLTLLREYFDFLDIGRAALRGAISIALPRVAPPPPGPDTRPGRSLRRSGER
ncbi:MAG: limonene-1,2-epoxide hydrolase family protein [Microthrixaceae bacterium]